MLYLEDKVQWSLLPRKYVQDCRLTNNKSFISMNRRKSLAEELRNGTGTGGEGYTSLSLSPTPPIFMSTPSVLIPFGLLVLSYSSTPAAMAVSLTFPGKCHTWVCAHCEGEKVFFINCV